MNPTIATLAWKALAGGRSIWLLLVFPVALVGLSLLVRVLSGDPRAAGDVLALLGYTLVLPLLALVATTAVMGPEVDDGSIVHLLAKPVSRYVVATSKYVVAMGTALVCGVVPLLVVGLAVGNRPTGWWAALALAAAFCTVVYGGLFLALSTVWRHAVVASLLFLLVWEGVLSAVFSGVAWLSVQAWGMRIAHAVHAPIESVSVPLWWALAAGVVVAVGGVWFSGDRLRSFSMRGDE